MNNIVDLPVRCPLEFHPLAEMFPLMEGAEFDGLVASIKESGLRDPIVMFEQKILDGRNRYRACLAASTDPKFIQFTDTDAMRFVIDHNLHRRHLNESQRGMIAAQFANRQVGGVSHDKTITGIPVMTQPQAAALMNVGRDTVTSARTVLSRGTPEEITAVREGRAAVHTVARQIRANKPANERSKEREGSEAKNQQTRQIKAQVWHAFREALENITGLPQASDVVPIARAHDRADFVGKRILQAHKWLEDFLNEWTSCDKAQSANTVADNHSVARKGNRTA